MLRPGGHTKRLFTGKTDRQNAAVAPQEVVLTHERQHRAHVGRSEGRKPWHGAHPLAPPALSDPALLAKNLAIFKTQQRILIEILPERVVAHGKPVAEE